MPQHDPDRQLRAYVGRAFPPEYNDLDAALAWVEQQVDERLFHLLSPLTTWISDFTRDINQLEELGRQPFVFLDPGDREGRTLIKRPRSIIEKMLRSEPAAREASALRRRTPQVHTPKNFLATMGDILRFRLICNYLSDVRVVVQTMRTRYKGEGQDGLKLLREVNRIDVTPEERQNGHRAWHLEFQFDDNGTPLRFEIQVTTILHWGWDKKDHSLVYEPRRLGQIPIRKELISIAAASDSLHLIDEYFDTLRRRMCQRARRQVNRT